VLVVSKCLSYVLTARQSVLSVGTKAPASTTQCLAVKDARFVSSAVLGHIIPLMHAYVP